jgi:hypothetical protein
LVENWKDGFHEILVVWTLLELTPLIARLRAWLLALLIVFNSPFQLLNFDVPCFFSFLDQVDEVIGLKDSSVRLDPEAVLAVGPPLTQVLPRVDVPDVQDLGVIVKEDLLRRGIV